MPVRGSEELESSSESISKEMDLWLVKVWMKSCPQVTAETTCKRKGIRAAIRKLKKQL